MAFEAPRYTLCVLSKRAELTSLQDFELYRGCGIFERLLSFSAPPTIPEHCFQEILVLLSRCTHVGGSSTLITRSGVVAWVTNRSSSCDNDLEMKARLRTLALRMYETSEQLRIDGWSDSSLNATLDMMRMSEGAQQPENDCHMYE